MNDDGSTLWQQRDFFGLDVQRTTCSFHSAWLIIDLHVLNTRTRRSICDVADNQRLALSRFPLIDFAESGNHCIDRAASHHLRIISFSNSLARLTLSSCKSLWLCANHRYTKMHRKYWVVYRSWLRQYKCVFEPVDPSTDLGRKTLSTT